MAVLRRPEHFWPAFWGVVVLLLAAVIFAEHEFGYVTVGEGTRSPAKVAEAKLLPPFSLPQEAGAGPEMTARPLFVPTRRPAPPAAAVAASTMKRGQFVVTGVTVTPDVSIAFLKEVANGKTIGAKKGTQVNGLTVEIVEPRRVVLKQGEELEELALNVQVPARVAVATPPAAAGAPQAGGVPPAPAVSPGGGAPAPAGAPPPGSINAQGLPTGSGVPPGLPGAQPGQPGAPAPATGRRRPWINTQ